MATKNGLIQDVEDMLYGMAYVERPTEDILGGSMTSGTTTMPTTTDKLWRRDSYAEIIPADGSVGEIMRIQDDATGNAATVRRAQRQTTAAAHSAGDVVRKNPYYPRVQIDRFIDEVIEGELYPHVWYRSDRTLTWVDQDYVYDLDADDFDVLSVYQYDINSDGQMYRFPDHYWQVEPVASAVSASGKILRLRRVFNGDATVRYTARTRPKVANLADFPDELANLIPWAVCGQLLGGTRSGPRRHDPNTQAEPEAFEGGVQRDWRFFEQKFLLKRDALTRQLRFEERELRQRRFIPARRGSRLRRVLG